MPRCAVAAHVPDFIYFFGAYLWRICSARAIRSALNRKNTISGCRFFIYISFAMRQRMRSPKRAILLFRRRHTISVDLDIYLPSIFSSVICIFFFRSFFLLLSHVIGSRSSHDTPFHIYMKLRWIERGLEEICIKIS